jgi:hypothetical protein
LKSQKQKIIINLIIFSIVLIFLYVFLNKKDLIVHKIKKKGYVSCSVLVWGKNYPNQIYSYIILYDAIDNVLKLFCINTNVKSCLTNMSIKEEFIKNITEYNSKLAISNFYKNFYSIIGNQHKIDFYFNININNFGNIINKVKTVKYNNNNDLQLIHQFNIIKCILRLTPRVIINTYKKYNLIDTNIPKSSFIRTILKIKLLQPQYIFYEMPIKFYKQQLKPDNINIQACLNKIYFCANTITKYNTENIIIDIKNASNKHRMAEKATWLLRKRKFDVINWSNNVINYETTLIKDYKGNFLQALNLAKLFNTNIIITSYNQNNYADICIFLGNDYKIIHDILDN